MRTKKSSFLSPGRRQIFPPLLYYMTWLLSSLFLCPLTTHYSSLTISTRSVSPSGASNFQTSYKLDELHLYRLRELRNLTKIVKFFSHELPSVEPHTHKFSRTSWNISKIWNCMSNFEIHFENLTPVKELWYNRIRKEKNTRSKFDRKSQIFRPQFSTRGECTVKGLWPLLYVSVLIRFYVI